MVNISSGDAGFDSPFEGLNNEGPRLCRGIVTFCEQRSIATKWGKQAIREADARKFGLLEVPLR